MPESQNSSDKFRIRLRENGGHSLWRGIEAYDEYYRSPDKMLLKDAIMYLHHGIELLLKEILVKHSPYLIFEDISDASKKQRQSDKQGIGIFFLERPPKTVTYEEAINRVVAFVRPSELGDVLITNLGRLNRLRNQLEHYEIEADVDEVTYIIASIRKPLLRFLEAELGEIEQLRTPRAKRILDRIEESTSRVSDLIQEVILVVQQFNGQKAPGKLFGLDDEIILPTFTKIQPEYQLPELGIRVDILCENEYLRWAIEVKEKITSTSRFGAMSEIARTESNAHSVNARAWLLVFNTIPERVRSIAKGRSLLATGIDEWRHIKTLANIK